MNAHLTKRGNRWTIVLELGMVDGKRQQRWVSGFALKTEAQTEMIRLLRDLQTGDYIEPSKLTVAEWLERWMRDYSVHLSRKTRANYQSIIGACGPIGKYTLQSLKSDHLQALCAEWQAAGIAPSTITSRLTALNAVFHQAVKLQVLGRNPVSGVVRPRAAVAKPKALTEAQTAILLREATGTSLYLPIVLALNTGMRRGEILGLTWANVRGDRIEVVQSVEEGGQLKEPKTKGSRRSIVVPGHVVTALREHLCRQNADKLAAGVKWVNLNLVFPNGYGSIWNPNSFTNAITKLLLVCGIEGTFHSLRHTHATRLMEMGVNPKVVQERLGHSNISQTMDTYSHVSVGMQEEVARALELRSAAVG
jgi:integrase